MTPTPRATSLSRSKTAHPARSWSIAGLVAMLALGIAACGGGADAAPAKAPGSTERSKEDSDKLVEPKTVEEAQDQIARARAELEVASRTPTGDASSSSTPPKATEPKAESRPSPQGGASPHEERYADTCGSPCRALASMRRAVEALCRLTGDGDNRCADARRTLTESTTRISSCKCEGH
jgi:hypothetical protein